jgi:hypothetical protein
MEEREYLGSLLMVSPEGAPAEKALPRGRTWLSVSGHTVAPPRRGWNEDLKRDVDGLVLGWEMSGDGKRGPGMRPVPPQVAEAAEEWLRDYRRDPKRFT